MRSKKKIVAMNQRIGKVQIQNKFEIVVIGAGAAGISATRAACEAGCRSILMIDSREKPGGVLLQCAHHGFGAGLTGWEYIEKLLEGFPEEISVWTDTTVLSVKEETAAGDSGRCEYSDSHYKERSLLVSGSKTGLQRVFFDQLILASGCMEIPMGFLPVSGTRPKGIYTAGQVQEMVNLYGKLPEGPVVILGSGDLGLIVAKQLADQGIEIAAMVERKGSCAGMARNRNCIRGYEIPLICSSTVTEIYGERELSGVKIKNSRTGETCRVSCRSLLAAVGLRPDRSLLDGLIKSDSRMKRDELKILPDQSEEYPAWIHLCGNCNVVHPMVDAVIKEGKQAGIAAWRYIERLL